MTNCSTTTSIKSAISLNYDRNTPFCIIPFLTYLLSHAQSSQIGIYQKDVDALIAILMVFFSTVNTLLMDHASVDQHADFLSKFSILKWSQVGDFRGEGQYFAAFMGECAQVVGQERAQQLQVDHLVDV